MSNGDDIHEEDDILVAKDAESDKQRRSWESSSSARRRHAATVRKSRPKICHKMGWDGMGWDWNYFQYSRLPGHLCLLSPGI